MVQIPETIRNIIQEELAPKEKEKRLYGEVFTPLEFVNKMLDEIPSSFWKNDNLTWYDPCCGIGNFPIVIYFRLMSSLKPIISNESKRSQHIIENMLFLNELNKTNVQECRRIFKLIEPNATLNLTNNNFLTSQSKTHFDIIVGNPPYNETSKSDSSDQPLYSKFIEKAIDLTKHILLFIVPSRWFTGGKGLTTFRQHMLARKDIVSIHHFPSSHDIWPTVDIKGGVNYFYLNKDKQREKVLFYLPNQKPMEIQLDKYDVLLPNPKAYSLVEQVLQLCTIKSPTESAFISDKANSYQALEKCKGVQLKEKGTLQSLYLSPHYYGIMTNSPLFKNKKTNSSDIKCYVSGKKGSVKYVSSAKVKNPYQFWKVFTPQGAGIGGDGFGPLIIGSPSEVASQTYFTLKVSSKSEAESLKSYLETDFANFMLSLRKIDQHISESTLEWIPLPPLDRKWTQAKVIKYFKLKPSAATAKTASRKKINNNKTKKRK